MAIYHLSNSFNIKFVPGFWKTILYFATESFPFRSLFIKRGKHVPVETHSKHHVKTGRAKGNNPHFDTIQKQLSSVSKRAVPSRSMLCWASQVFFSSNYEQICLRCCELSQAKAAKNIANCLNNILLIKWTMRKGHSWWHPQKISTKAERIKFLYCPLTSTFMLQKQDLDDTRQGGRYSE